MSKSPKSPILPKLYLCATPIGNLGDITLRVLDTLRAADTIYCEDTRVTRKLLAHFEIGTLFARCDENTLLTVWPKISGAVKSGQTMAFVTDAGMPGISDPGLRLVQLARLEDVPFEVLPGASSVQTALLTTGFVKGGTAYYFGGFLPRKQGRLKTCLENLAGLPAVLIFFESPHRVQKSLPVINEIYPNAQVALARELSKIYEETLIAPASDLFALLEMRQMQGRQLKGECVILIDNTI